MAHSDTKDVTLADVEEYLDTTITAPTHGWYEVYKNTDPDKEENVHLAAVEYDNFDKFVSIEILAGMMDGEWYIEYHGTTQAPPEEDSE